MSLEQDYKIARAVVRLRQPFLSSLNLGEYSPFISRIVYVIEGSFSERLISKTGGMANLSLNPFQEFFGFRKIKSTILVDKRPFEYLENPYDFLGFLLHHEGEHARERIAFRSKRFKTDYREARAWTNQMRKLDERCSKEYKEMVRKEFADRIKFLDEVEK